MKTVGKEILAEVPDICVGLGMSAQMVCAGIRDGEIEKPTAKFGVTFVWSQDAYQRVIKKHKRRLESVA